MTVHPHKLMMSYVDGSGDLTLGSYHVLNGVYPLMVSAIHCLV